jgi:hypothetical protein
VDEPPRRRRPWRPLWFIGAAAFIVGLAFLVGRPAREPPAATPYAGKRSASRTKEAGLEIFYWRAGELHVAQPGTPLREGDTLRFVVRGERARYVAVDLRDGGPPAVRVFPADAGATKAELVQPGQALPVNPKLGAAPGSAVVTARFSDQPFDPAGPPGPDTEELRVVMEKERAAPAP